MPEAKFETLFRGELELLYDAEKQIVAGLPKMIAAASSVDLASVLQDHLGDAEEQVKRLEAIFEDMGEEPGGHLCEAMLGLMRESDYLIAKMEKSPVRDTGLIGAAQKIEQYEICGYETARNLAEMLGQSETVDLLDQTLDEETAASETLSDLAEAVISGSVEHDYLDEGENVDERADGAA